LTFLLYPEEANKMIVIQVITHLSDTIYVILDFILFQSEEKKFKTLMKDSGKSSAVIEEICSTDKFDKEAYDEARQKAAKVLQEEKSENSEKKTAGFGKNRKKFHNQRK
jgi:hypothetical protein